MRYGDSDGFAIDGERPTLWRYRDYVIRTFNEDRPIDRFIREQLAGDETGGGSEGLVATGFYRLGPWEADNMTPERREQDFLNEITSAVGTAFLGLTIGCARCHDHKYDPITQKDFYKLQAFLKPLKRSRVQAAFGDGELSAAVGRRKVEAEGEREYRRQALAEFRTTLKQTLAQARSADGATVSDKDLDEALKKKDEPFSEKQRKQHKELKAAVDEFKEAERYAATACTIENPKGDATVPATHVLLNGDVFSPGEKVTPGFLSAVEPLSDALSRRVAKAGETAAGRRRVLAEWVASPGNPLTARVFVNRVWQQHMGQGLVATANDFGKNGAGVSHPDLLDFLASRFIADGWRLKPLHRLLVLSNTYRMSSTHPDRQACMEVDPDNRLCWHGAYRRLESEALRDAMLAVSGSLDFETGGPGLFEKLPEQMGAKYPFFTWTPSSEQQRRRRSIYMFQRRNLMHPMMAVFDAAEMSESCEQRKNSVTAPQALTLLNGAFAQDVSDRLARRVATEAAGGPGAQVDHLFRLAFNRPPRTDEVELCMRFLDTKRAMHEARREARDGAPAAHLALRDLCLAVINANEFLYLD